MFLEWCLIFSVTGVSTTMLMVLSSYLAVLHEAQQYYEENQTMILLFTNLFNIFHLIVTPIIFHRVSKQYVFYVLISTVATGVSVIGRYMAGPNYYMCLFMTLIVALCHIPIITAPYGLLKLFPDSKKGYAASTPLFLPALGINFCILYGREYILGKQNYSEGIENLNFIIAIFGIISCSCTIYFVLKLRSKIQADDTVDFQITNVGSENMEEGERTQNTGQIPTLPKKVNCKSPRQGEVIEQNLCESLTKLFNQKKTCMLIIAWGTILGISWTYGALFQIIFSGQGLSDQDLALIGLAANLSSAVFSNLGTFIKNNFYNNDKHVIFVMNLIGIFASLVIWTSGSFQFGLPVLIILIILLRIGFSSFVSIALELLDKSGLPSVIMSGFFFWIANLSNEVTMQIVDLVNINVSQIFIIIIVGLSILLGYEYTIK